MYYKKGVFLIKKNIIILTIIISCIITIIGCTKKNNINSAEEFAHTFATNNNYTICSIESFKNKVIMTYETEKEYGLIIFNEISTNKFIDDSHHILKKDNIVNNVAYITATEKEYNYIGLFILDKDILEKAEDLSLQFNNYANPYKVTQSIKSGGIILSYVNKTKNNEDIELKEIIILDDNQNIIYSTAV